MRSIMKFFSTLQLAALLSTLGTPVSAQNTSMGLIDPSVSHPLDGLTFEEHEAIVSILKESGRASNTTLFAQVSLLEPPKAQVKAFLAGDNATFTRSAVVYLKETTSFYKAVVDIAAGSVTTYEVAKGQGMWIGEEFNIIFDTLHDHPEVAAGLAARGLNKSNAYCYPLSTGDYDTGIESGRRIGRAACSGIGDGTNGVAYPVEGLVAWVDMYAYEVLYVIDNGVVPMNTDEFGFSEELLRERFGTLRGEDDRRKARIRNLRQYDRKRKIEKRIEENKKKPGYRKLQAPEEAKYTMDGSKVAWDIWEFQYRFDIRQGHMITNVKVNDLGTERDVMYSAMLSEVFVPYMDPDDLWWFRTYMDVGEYGFGLSYTPLTPGIDCPPTAMYMETVMHDAFGMPYVVPNSVCLFERYTGDPAWRHYMADNYTFSETGRPDMELVLRGAATIGNYDYLLDYVFKQDGVIKFAVGATGQDITKGVASTSTMDPTYEEDTKHGMLIAENLVAPDHDHFFNFRLDLDVDGEDNTYVKAKYVRKEVERGIPRKSIWTMEKDVIESEMAARTRIDPNNPSMFLFGNTNVQGALGHTPMYRLEPKGTWAYSLLAEDDVPYMRNAYVENQVWVTPYDPEQLYSGGEYVYQSDGSDTLKTWTEADRAINNTDIVVWYTLGFYHHPRMEDWPVMPTKWMEFQLSPFNFFGRNPAINLAPVEMVQETVTVEVQRAQEDGA